MKKYLIVAWDNCCPSPGLGNIRDSFDDLTIAEAYFELSCMGREQWDNINLVDRDTLEILKKWQGET